ncbi:LCP family protein [Paenibacillus sp. TC-CSREp1]|uniref:LCP family protein n=1 Tax=Paenibacillus sp. TC-CSREp1 TaxID=3410089 RepID=UPI003CFE3464
MESKKRNKRKKINKTKWAVISLTTLLLLCGFGYLFRKELSVFAFNAVLKKEVKTTLNKSYKPVGYEVKSPKIELSEPFSLLLLGIDQREGEPSRSDTIIYSVIRPKDDKILLISIPRDSYTDIIGRGVTSKINSAYAHGGAKMSIDTVENLLKNKVNYYAAINFNGLKDIVDAIGGVKLPITEVIENKNPIHEKLRVEPNKPIYYGADALSYVRYREDSDFKRTERQRIFISSLMDKALEMKNISKIPELIDIAGSNFTTNMDSEFILNLAETVYLKNSAPKFENYMLQGNGKIRGTTWYYDLDPEDLEYAQKLITSWLSSSSNEGNLLHPKNMD